jgi:hypothetical protein
MRLLLSVVRRWSLRIYLRAYSDLAGLSWHEVKEWLGVVALLRLSDNIPEERASLVRLIEKEFAASR